MTTQPITTRSSNGSSLGPSNGASYRAPQDGSSPPGSSSDDSVWSSFKRIFQWSLLKETFDEWSRDNASRLAAALAYYTVTALAQLLIGLLAIVGLVYSSQAARAQLTTQANRVIGGEGGQVIEAILSNADQPELARTAGIISLILLLWSGSNIFVQLQNSLDTVWGVELRRDLPLWEKVKRRLLPIAMVFGIGLLMVLATLAGAVLSALSAFVTDLLPGGAILWQVINIVITLAVITVLFALIFKLLPSVEIAWRDVWPGAALTAALFIIGQIALSWYLGRQSSASTYGAAGSLIVLLIWIYYSAQIFLFGAEFTQVYAVRYGEGVRPDEDAVPLGSQLPQKPAALHASGKVSAWHGRDANGTSRLGMEPGTRAWPRETYQPENLSTLSKLAASIGSDFRMLSTQEWKLARAEIQEMLQRAQRAAGLTAGGGIILYAAALLLVGAVALLASLIMPLWLAALLVGVLLLVEGWLMTIWARQKLNEAAHLPQQAAQSVQEDVETVKAHLAN
jgi:membrane protein